ncbi:MAG: hypothetical protein QOH73_708 [Gaiellaceae bacterium]|nr:hypothetical protein [Gaiellaceae bacterium]
MERKALETAGASYYTLRGLFGIPLGALLVCAGLGNLAWGPFRHLWVFWAAVAVVALVSFWIMRYYRDSYGRVTQSRRHQTKVAVLTALGALMIWGGMTLDWKADLPVDATAASFAAVMLVYYAATVGPRRHHAVIWGSLLLTGLVPLWGDVSGDSKINGGLILLGLVTMTSGLFDHLALKRAFAHG